MQMSPQSSPVKKSRQIVGLDALRFAASMMVVVFHFGFWDWTRIERGGAPFPATHAGVVSFSWFGWVGVEMFFVLSGFVIAYSAERATAASFFQHRLTRLFPGALICATLTAIVLAAGGTLGAKRIVGMWLRSILFFPKGAWVDKSYWTLSMEISFYAVIFLLLFFRRYRWMPFVVGLMGCGSTVFWMVAFAPASWPISRLLHPAIAAIGGNGTANTLIKVSLLAPGCQFAIGVFLWLWLYRGGLTVVRAVLLTFWIAGGALEIVCRARLLNEIDGFSFSALLPVVIWLAAIAVIVVAVKQNDAIHHAVGVRGANLLRRVGLMTYPLYLLHQEIGERLMFALAGRMNWKAASVISPAAMIALAYLVSVYGEPGLQSMLRQFLRSIAVGRERASARLVEAPPA